MLKGAAAYRRPFKAVAVGNEVHVFDLSNDPGEMSPLAEPLPTLARMAASEAVGSLETLEAREFFSEGQEPLDEEIRVHLESLGYI
jgi:hypothetical protein